MLHPVIIFAAAVAALSLMVWFGARTARTKLAARRQGALMSHLDWTRQPETRRGPQKKSLFDQLLR